MVPSTAAPGRTTRVLDRHDPSIVNFKTCIANFWIPGEGGMGGGLE